MPIAKKGLLALLLCLVTALYCAAAAADAVPEKTPAEGPETIPEEPAADNVLCAILYEESTDTYLFEKNPDQTNAPASMTKVMTAVLVLEKDPTLSGVLTVAPEAVQPAYCSWMDTNHLYEGEVISVWDCMNYLLIPSGNEAATALAIHFSGSVNAFVEEMNQKAAELGMTNTRYIDPHGLMGPPQLISARDMLTLCRYAMTFANFRKIVSTKEGVVPASNMRKAGFTYKTTNRVMDPRGYEPYDTGFAQDILGIKTGSTPAAGYNLACCMTDGALTIYSVVMHGQDDLYIGPYACTGSFLDTARLMKYARQFEKYGFAAGDTVEERYVAGLWNKFAVTAGEDIYILKREGSASDMEIALDELSGPIAAGDVVGTLTLRDEFGNARTTALRAAADANIMPWTVYFVPALALLLVFALAARPVLARAKKRRAAADGEKA